MCHKWSLKLMVCGHIDIDNQVLYCANYSPLYSSCLVREHGADTVRPYTEGDGTELDQSARAQLDITRTFLFSLESVETPDLCNIQDKLIFEYIRTGVVLDVIPMLQELHCDLSELVNQANIENSSAWAEEISFTPMTEYEVPMLRQTGSPQWGEALQVPHPTPVPLSEQNISYNSGNYMSPPTPTLEQWTPELPMSVMGDIESFSDELGGEQQRKKET
ncbi:uncharacterized protein F4812DRAFT_464741 [Daldinia caldariorum]|uniref:uncharacterized protein n=1 Tax=Daldinia caldariorum TaxID=326644 RepID=UPI0020087475|nr:uncharacterized protein F4812DRAFT_464741 [Daldinia caldariorum]KAI1472694.1 hypothetical protein F4812DRAFT_464741 [Daldinia caldariorum]